MRLYFWSSVKDENWARTASVDVMMKLDVTNKRGGARLPSYVIHSQARAAVRFKVHDYGGEISAVQV